MTQPIKVGLAGFGMAAKVMHAPFLASMPEYALHSVLERNKEESKQRYPYVQIVRDFDSLISDPSVELVVITTPNNTHFEYAQKAIEFLSEARKVINKISGE